jgi:type I restriction enzyme S subunit
MEVWATGANILNLGSEAVRKMPIPMREADEQVRIAARCRDGDLQMAALATSLAEDMALLQERKRSLITATVTGEFDVSSASSLADAVVSG